MGDAEADDVFADDLTVGTTFALGSYVITEPEIVDFARRWDPQFFHVDPLRAATDTAFGGLIASGIHTLAVYERLWVQSRTATWHVIAGAGIDDLRFRRPVRPNDVLVGGCEVTVVRLNHSRGRGLVTFAGWLSNQHGEIVLRLVMSVYLAIRGGQVACSATGDSPCPK